MEADPRSFEPVKVGVVNTESGYERFYRDHIYRAPNISYWRVNITALSQRYNLYFLATRDKVQVYRPDFPYQTLGSTPILTIVPQLAKSHARGFIDPLRPHGINHLIVGDLGNQEILLLSTDSGNVVAYYTSSIDTAIEKDPHKFSEDGNADFVGLRPFFSQWVQESAWGLAIHSEGRMIAVSANKPDLVPDEDPSSKITVFAFALSMPSRHSNETQNVKAGTNSPTESSEWKSWSPSADADWSDTPHRDCNYKIVLKGKDGHIHNAPCITFINTSEDKAGSWLLSTDVAGRMKLWQIWKGECARTWNFDNQREGASAWTLSGDSGWVVAALDIRAFRLAETMDKFIGYYRAPQYYGYHASGDSYDLTNVVRRFTPQNSPNHPYLAFTEIGVTDEEETEGDVLYQAAIDSEPEDLAELALEPTSASEEHQASGRNQTLLPSNNIAGENEPNDELIVISDDDEEDNEIAFGSPMETNDMDNVLDVPPSDRDDDDDDVEAEESTPDSLRSATTISSYTARGSDDYETTDLEDELLGAGSIVSTRSMMGVKHRSRLARTKTKSNRSHRPILPQIPILHCSTSHIRLFSGPEADYPHLFCARMLSQKLPQRMEYTHFSALDRLCMLQQIPELGIVLIATQLGRCAVCTLTKRATDGLLGLRVDWILPTKKQERAGARPPHHVLLGIATSPIQGREVLKHDLMSGSAVDRNWSKDCIINGTPTTFDPEVVVLSPRSQAAAGNRSSSNQRSQSYTTLVEKREWSKPVQEEEWKAYEHSRRYRLMLTYSDLTVLTYELSRKVEREDINVK